jgi:type IV secretory pathway protease TraF
MIGKAGTGNGFSGLLSYLLAGSDGQQNDRPQAGDGAMKRPRTLVPLGLLVFICLAGLGLGKVGFALNFTPSLPLGVYLRADLQLEPGVLVSVCLEEEVAQEARYQGILAAGSCPGAAVPLLKKIAAVGGGVVDGDVVDGGVVDGGVVDADVVEITAEGIFVAGRWLQPPAPRRSALGLRLRPWPVGRYEIGPGQLWLTADHPRSWDSRYFGPVEAASVLGTYRPLWTWNR